MGEGWHWNYVWFLVSPATRFLVSDSLTENCSRKDWWRWAVIKQSAGPLPLSQNLLRVTKFQELGLNFENPLLCPETIFLRGMFKDRPLIHFKRTFSDHLKTVGVFASLLTLVVNCICVFEDIFHAIISRRLLFHWISEATVKPKRWQRPEKNEQRKSGQATQKLLSLLPSFALKIFRHLMKRYLTIEKCLNRELRIPFGVWFTIVIFMQRGIKLHRGRASEIYGPGV